MDLGKSIYIWQPQAICKGDARQIAETLKTAGFETAILHAENLSVWRTAQRIALVTALRDVGIEPVGGAAVYGANPQAEGEQSAQICIDYGLKAFIFDAETAFDRVDHPDTAAVNLLKAFRGKAPGVKAGWCWWAFHHSTDGRIEYHPKSILWAAMAPGYGDADFGVPMMYWSWGDQASAAVRYLEASWAQWWQITNKPICPVGRAYIGEGGTARPEAIAAFEKRARELGAAGVTWWSAQHALDQAHLPGVWQALAGLQPFGIATPEPQPVPAPIPTPAPVSGLYMRAVRAVNIRAGATTASADLGDVKTGDTVGPIVGIAGGRTGAWAHLADGRYVCVADTNGIVYLIEG